MSEPIVIRGYSVVFRLERRLHRIDRWRIPLPYGLPMLAIAYAAVALAVVIALTQAPVVGAVVGAAPAPLRFVVVPVGVGIALTRARPDGRPAHRHLHALLTHKLTARRRATAARRADRLAAHRLDAVRLAGGAHDLAARRGRVRGPAGVVLRAPARARTRGPVIHLTPRAGWLRRPQLIRLQAGQRLEVRP